MLYSTEPQGLQVVATGFEPATPSFGGMCSRSTELRDHHPGSSQDILASTCEAKLLLQPRPEVTADDPPTLKTFKYPGLIPVNGTQLN